MKPDKKIFWLFRSNLPQLEPYHEYINDKERFIEECYDFYLLMSLSFLQQDFFDKVVIWRIKPKLNNNINKEYSYNIGEKQFVQKFVTSFDECLFEKERPQISLFRGGFPEYDSALRKNKNAFGKSVYLGAGKRTIPNNNLYDLVLFEDDRERYYKNFRTGLFYKTSNSNFFYPICNEDMYDILWICNFSQITQKGQEFFFSLISRSNILKSLRIFHIGNLEFRGRSLATKYKVTNVKFFGYKKRKEINKLLSFTKLAIVTSNQNDGSPRVISEILCSGTPLLIRNITRCPSKYKQLPGVFEYTEKTIEEQLRYVLTNYKKLRQQMAKLNRNELSIDNISRLNYLSMIDNLKMN